jgi:sugar phosphate isomerase/epimerase
MSTPSTRREFLSTGMAASAAATVAATAAGAALAAAPAAPPAPARPKPRMHLGLVTYMIGAEMDLPTLLKTCEQSGMEGVELRSTHKHGVEPSLDAAGRDRVKQAFAKTRVRCYALGSACEYHSPDPAAVQKNIQLTRDFVQLAADLGCWGVKVRPNGLPKEVPVEKTLAQIATALKECGDFAKEKSVMLTVECHGGGTSHPPHMARIMELADHPAVCLCWNCNGKGDEVDGSIKPYFTQCQRWVQHLHIHDLYEGYRYDELFEMLKAAAFDKFTMIEMGGTTDPVRVLRYYRALWERLAA